MTQDPFDLTSKVATMTGHDLVVDDGTKITDGS